MRYAYGLTAALLLGGAAASLTTGYIAGAQVAQNDATQMRGAVPRAGAPESFATLTEQLAPAVVNISTRQRIEVQSQQNPFAGTPFEGLFGNRGQGGQGQPQTREGRSLGSGFIISADGFLVTNNHVISPQGRGTVQEITVTMPDGAEYPATLVGADAASDLAVLKISASKPLPFVNFGKSTETRVGDWVVAIGNPFGLGGTVTSGIISSVLRTTGQGGAYDRYIQTDAAINMGNSGGPLFDMQGNVIGINNAIFSPSGTNVGIGFAIPADIAAPIVEQLKAGREITRGYLGVSIQPVDSDLADSLGIANNRGELVQSVVAGEPGDRAGIRPGDVVLSVNNKPVTRDQTLSFIVANVAPGTRVPLEIIRDGRRLNVTATVGRRPTDEALRQQQMFENEESGVSGGQGGMAQNQPSSLIQERLGLSVVPLTPQIAGQLGVGSGTQGVAIADVDQGSDAARKGLQRGDIVLSANYRDVANPTALEGAVRQAQADNREAVLLRIQRRGRPAAYVAVRLR